MKPFNEDNTITNQDKKEFLSQILKNNKYSEDIIDRIKQTILLIDAMIDRQPKINTPQNQDESDDDSDYRPDYESDDEIETGYGKSFGDNQFSNINVNGGKTRRRRSRKMKTKKGKKSTRKMKKNKKTKKTSK